MEACIFEVGYIHLIPRKCILRLKKGWNFVFNYLSPIKSLYLSIHIGIKRLRIAGCLSHLKRGERDIENIIWVTVLGIPRLKLTIPLWCKAASFCIIYSLKMKRPNLAEYCMLLQFLLYDSLVHLYK